MSWREKPACGPWMFVAGTIVLTAAAAVCPPTRSIEAWLERFEFTLGDQFFTYSPFDVVVRNLSCRRIVVGGLASTRVDAGLDLAASEVAITCSGDYAFELSFWPHVPYGSGRLEGESAESTLALALSALASGPSNMVGDVVISSCGAEVRLERLDFGGGFTASVLSAFSGVLRPILEDAIAPLVCDAARDLLDSLNVAEVLGNATVALDELIDTSRPVEEPLTGPPVVDLEAIVAGPAAAVNAALRHTDLRRAGAQVATALGGSDRDGGSLPIVALDGTVALPGLEEVALSMARSEVTGLGNLRRLLVLPNGTTDVVTTVGFDSFSAATAVAVDAAGSLDICGDVSGALDLSGVEVAVNLRLPLEESVAASALDRGCVGCLAAAVHLPSVGIPDITLTLSSLRATLSAPATASPLWADVVRAGSIVLDVLLVDFAEPIAAALRGLAAGPLRKAAGEWLAQAVEDLVNSVALDEGPLATPLPLAGANESNGSNTSSACGDAGVVDWSQLETIAIVSEAVTRAVEAGALGVPLQSSVEWAAGSPAELAVNASLGVSAERIAVSGFNDTSLVLAPQRRAAVPASLEALAGDGDPAAVLVAAASNGTVSVEAAGTVHLVVPSPANGPLRDLSFEVSLHLDVHAPALGAVVSVPADAKVWGAQVAAPVLGAQPSISAALSCAASAVCTDSVAVPLITAGVGAVSATRVRVRSGPALWFTLEEALSALTAAVAEEAAPFIAKALTAAAVARETAHALEERLRGALAAAGSNACIRPAPPPTPLPQTVVGAMDISFITQAVTTAVAGPDAEESGDLTAVMQANAAAVDDALATLIDGALEEMPEMSVELPAGLGVLEVDVSSASVSLSALTSAALATSGDQLQSLTASAAWSAVEAAATLRLGLRALESSAVLVTAASTAHHPRLDATAVVLVNETVAFGHLMGSTCGSPPHRVPSVHMQALGLESNLTLSLGTEVQHTGTTPDGAEADYAMALAAATSAAAWAVQELVRAHGGAVVDGLQAFARSRLVDVALPLGVSDAPMRALVKTATGVELAETCGLVDAKGRALWNSLPILQLARAAMDALGPAGVNSALRAAITALGEGYDALTTVEASDSTGSGLTMPGVVARSTVDFGDDVGVLTVALKNPSALHLDSLGKVDFLRPEAVQSLKLDSAAGFREMAIAAALAINFTAPDRHVDAAFTLTAFIDALDVAAIADVALSLQELYAVPIAKLLDVKSAHGWPCAGAAVQRMAIDEAHLQPALVRLRLSDVSAQGADLQPLANALAASDDGVTSVVRDTLRWAMGDVLVPAANAALSSALDDWSAMCTGDSANGTRDGDTFPAETGRQALKTATLVFVCVASAVVASAAVCYVVWWRRWRRRGPCKRPAGEGSVLAGSLAWTVGPVFGWGVAVAVVLAIGIFSWASSQVNASLVVAVDSPLVNVHVESELYAFSLNTLIQDLARGGLTPIALVIAFLSGVWPFIKLTALLLCWVLPDTVLPAAHRGHLLEALHALGKWSLADVAIIQLAAVAFHFELIAPDDVGFSVGTAAVSVVPGPGVFGLLAGTLL